MPPKKRPAAADAATSTAKRAKKVSIGGTSVIGEPDNSKKFASGRPKRESTGQPNYNTKKTKIGPPPTKNPGFKATKTTDTAPLPPAKRGRPRKDASAATETAKAPATPPKKANKSAGKPRKVKSPSSKFTRVKKHNTPQPAKEAPKKVGRPKATSKPSAGDIAGAEAGFTSTASGKPRGRPKSTESKAKGKDAASKSANKATAKKIGRPKPTDTKAKGKGAVSKAQSDIPREDLEGLTANESDWDNVEDDEDKQYWLMKAEPDSRIEKGVDVKFSIDDLQKAEAPEPWDGVRNPVARNNMRAMKKGDLAFFYHSNCKIPGIVGIMEIAEEHSIDESAFDENHPYYDPKSSRAKPKWELVHVKFVHKFPNPVTLAELKSFAKPGGALENMQMLKQSRLSVSAVKPREWRFIHGLLENDDLDTKPEETTKAVKAQVLRISEEVVRKVDGEGVNDDQVNGSYGGGAGDPAITSKLTTTSVMGKDDTETEE